jgi:hypothetical protein
MNLSDLLSGAMEEGPKNDLEQIFCEEPVPLDVFVRDKKFMGAGDAWKLSDVQYECVRYAERIYFPEIYPVMGEHFDPYWAEPIRMVNFVNLQWGKGSGKGHVCRTISLRVAYLLLCLRSPQEYFKMPAQDSIHLLNVAMNAQQAQRAFFDPVEALVRTSPWFKDKAAPTRGAIVFSKNVEAISGHSEAESQEGLNLLLGVADEIDGFRSKEEVRGNSTGRVPQNTVEGILDMMRTSSSTRFPRTFKNVRISYPRYLGSAIQRLTAQSRQDIEKNGENSRHYVSGPLPTWVVNPNFKDFELVAVDGTDELVPSIYVEDYEEDATMAKAKYECKPSKASNPFFRNEFLVRNSFTPVTRQPIEVNYFRSGDSWEVQYDFSPDLKPIKGAQYAMHGDLAVTQDKAGIAMAHVVRKEEFESEVTLESGETTTVREMRPIVKVDFVLSFEAGKGENPPREIQIRWARELAFELRRRGFRIKRFTFDGYESRDSMQQLQKVGIESKKVSTDRSNEPWRNLMDVMYDGRLVAGEREFLINELLGLTILPNGKIDHPRLGSKDEADALACAVFGAVEQGGREAESGDVAFYNPVQVFMGPRVELPLGMSHSLMHQQEF